jgi:hypothetical protein
MIFVTALGIIVVLAGLALVFAQEMRNEAIASANRRAQAQADATELAAEQWVLAQVDDYRTDAYTLSTLVQSDTISVGSTQINGYFWILPADISQVQGPVCGITDESSKLNINRPAMVTTGFTNLCDDLDLTLPDDTSYSITNWANLGSNANGATSTDYSSLPEPYTMKEQPMFETVEELLLVGQQQDIQENIMPQLLWGTDTGRNMLMWEYNQESGGLPSSTSSSTGGLNNITTNANPGIFNYLTVYSVIGTGAAANRLINPFTASPVVLEAIGFTQAQAESIVQARDTAYESSSGKGGANGYTWAIQAAGGGAGAAGNFLTGASYRYSADIVAASPDGRAFRRVRIVVDCSRYNPLGNITGSNTPPTTIIYRKDLTAYGWPLPEQIRQQLQKGTQLQPGALGEMLMAPGGTGQGNGAGI